MFCPIVVIYTRHAEYGYDILQMERAITVRGNRPLHCAIAGKKLSDSDLFSFRNARSRFAPRN